MTGVRKPLAIGFGTLAATTFALTLLSTIRSNQWWIRVLDFPRLLSLIALVLIAMGCLLTMRRARAPVLAALALAAGWQAWRLWPYTALAGTEMAAQVGGRSNACFSVLGLNVLQSNRRFAATIALIERESPDILLLLETDGRWVNALAPVLRRYPHRLIRPLDNTYGLVFATRLPVDSAVTENITNRDTPTLYARLRTREGRSFGYVGLHPRPPRPGQDTGARDAKIVRSARRTGDLHLPTVAMGDFNDVAWSHTTQLFKQVGGYRDPRIGRGQYATFPATLGGLGWPLDQMFVSPGFTFRSLRVLEDVGSDHRPLAATLCLPAPTSINQTRASSPPPADRSRRSRSG